MSQVVTLYRDKEKTDALYPRTKVSAISDNNNKALSEIINDEVNARQEADNVLTARINTITSLPEGSTTGDAELIDIRVGANGTTYDSAGDAVRGQVSELKSDLDDLVLYSKNLLNNETITYDKNFKANSTEIIDATDYTLTDYIAVNYGETLYFSRYNVSANESILKALSRILEYDENKNPITNAIASDTTFTPTNANCKYVRCTFMTIQNTGDMKTMISKSSDITYEEYFKKVKDKYLPDIPDIPNYEFDNEPTKDSQNLLTSGVIYDALNNDELYHNYLPLGKDISVISNSYMSDMCVVNDDLWVFNASADSQTTPTDTILPYAKVSIIDKNNGSEKSHFYQNFGHCNSVAYRKEDDSLVFGNGSTKAIDDLFTKRCFYIIQGITDVLSNAPIDSDGSITGEIGAKYIDLMSNAIEYDVTSFGYKVNTIFGSLPRNVFVITNDGKNIRELILGRANVDFGNGNFISGKEGRQYNGTYKIVNEWTIDNFPDVVQGAEYRNGYIYFGVGHSDRWICRAKITSKNHLEIESYKDILYTNGGVKTSQTSSGITFDNNRMLLLCGSGALLEYDLIH